MNPHSLGVCGSRNSFTLGPLAAFLMDRCFLLVVLCVRNGFCWEATSLSTLTGSELIFHFLPLGLFRTLDSWIIQWYSGFLTGSVALSCVLLPELLQLLSLVPPSELDVCQQTGIPTGPQQGPCLERALSYSNCFTLHLSLCLSPSLLSHSFSFYLSASLSPSCSHPKTVSALPSPKTPLH